MPASAFGALSDHILSGRSALSATVAEPLLDAIGGARRRTPVLSLGARVSGGVLRFARQPTGRAGLRRRHRQSAVGHDPRRLGSAPTNARARGSRPTPSSASRAMPASMPRSRTATRTGTSCSSSARLQLTRRGGRIGLVLPSGVTSDHGSAGLRRLLFSQMRRRRHRRIRQPRRRVPDPSEHPVRAAHRDKRPADQGDRLPPGRAESRPPSNRADPKMTTPGIRSGSRRRCSSG